MLTTVIQLPQVGESVTEGIIGKWLVKPGDHVEKYAPLVEVMTDKVNMEMPSPFAGTLSRLLVEEGDTVPMGAPIAEMEVLQGDAPDGPAGPEPVPPAPTATPMAPVALPHGDGDAGVRGLPGPTEPGTLPHGTGSAHPEPRAHPERSRREGRVEAEVERAPTKAGAFEFVESVRSVGPTGSGEGGQGLAATPTPASATPRHAASAGATEGKTAPDAAKLSPLVRRLVAQHGLDARDILGTGMGGRITKDDVLAYVAAHESGEALVTAHPERPERRAAAPTPTLEPGDSWLPLTPLRKTIAEHLARSAREIPAAWAMVEADVTGLVACRAAHRDAFERSNGVPLTYLPFAAQAVAQALTKHPLLNGRWGGDHIHLNGHVNLGVAVSTKEGLIVPVVHDAPELGVAALALRIHELAEAARAKTLGLEDVQGGTFTLNNTGALGSVVSVPIINHPQAAILTTEAIVKRPVVVEDDGIAVRSMMNLCIAFDHRVCDGADAGRFMADVKASLEAITADTPLE